MNIKSTRDAWDLALNVPRNALNVKMFRQPAAHAASFFQLCVEEGDNYACITEKISMLGRRGPPSRLGKKNPGCMYKSKFGSNALSVVGC